jgi:DNA-binding TFAR19-related protein (PDSD5 family)
VSVAPTVTSIVPRTAPNRAPRAVEPLKGTQARLTAETQGRVWQADAAVSTIAHHVETAETIDQRGDALMVQHRRQLARALRMARTEGAHQTAELLVELVASGALLAEIDDAEDWHRRQTGAQASDADQALDVANAVCGLLLGQSEAEMPDGMVLPFPLDGGGL